jgi:hypothetical protein
MASTHDLYTQTASQMYFTLILGDKPQFQAPAWYYPMGGGIAGLDADEPVLNNGMPTQASILKLARPIVIPVRQNIMGQVDFFPIGSTDVLEILNEDSSDVRIIGAMIDGLQTRDVQ